MRIALLILVASGVPGCTDDAPLTSYPLQVAAEGAVSAEIHLEYEGGSLTLEPLRSAAEDVDPDAAPLLLLDARTNRAALRPSVQSERKDGAVLVHVHQPLAQDAFGKRSQNEWRAALDAEMETRIRIDAGVLGGTFQLGGMTLPEIEVHAKQGQLDFDFTQAPVRSSTNLLVELGHGYVRVRVPYGIKARVRSREAVGRLIVQGIAEVDEGVYADEGFSDAPVKIDVTLGVMMGQLLVERIQPTGS